MAQRRAKTARRRSSSSPRRRSRYVCPDCGFKAAHPAGLGRHRTAIHGAVSKREMNKRQSSRGRASTDAQLTKRVAELERRYDRLLSGLEQVLRRAKAGRKS